MKAYVLLISILPSVALSAQSVDSIGRLVHHIDKTRITDSFEVTKFSDKSPVRLVAYLSGDTVLKTKVTFKNSARVRMGYYGRSKNLTDGPCYVREYDSVTGKQVTEVYGFDEHPYNNTDYAIELAVAKTERSGEKYHFTVRLEKALSHPPGCGIMAFALLQKFEVLKTDFPNYDKKYVLLIQQCPEFLGKNFFKTGKIYEVDVATTSGAPFDYIYGSNYKNEHLPTFWNRAIKLK